jgi:acyl-CoA thioesterase I
MLIPCMVDAQGQVRSDKPLNIFTIGDSNGTFAYSWPNQLAMALPKARVFNHSVSGQTIGFVNNGDSSLNSLLVIEQNLKKAADHTKDLPYDFVIVALGTNDAKAVFADRQDEVPSNLEKLINKIRNSSYSVIRKAKIIILSPPPYCLKTESLEKYKGGGKRVKAMGVSFAKIAERNSCLFVNGFEVFGLEVETMTDDGLHLNEIGSWKFAEPVVSLITTRN